MRWLIALLLFCLVWGGGAAAAQARWLAAAQLGEAAVAEVYRRADIPPGDPRLTVHIVSSPDGLEVPAEDVQLQVAFLYGLRYNAPTVAEVTVLAGTQQLGQAALRLEVRRYQQVVVASRPLEAGTVLQAADLQLLRLETGRLQAGYLLDPARAAGLQLRRDARSGEVLFASMLFRPPVLRRGATVALCVRRGGLEVSVPGEALQDGRPGQWIRVRNKVSGKLITAKVIDEATVEVASFGR